MTIDSVGVSNTSGYSFTGGDPTSTGGIVGVGNGLTAYTPMVGGGKKRRKLTKKNKALSKMKLDSIKKYVRKKKSKRRKKNTMKRRKLRSNIIKSIESGKQISNNDKSKLTPSMQAFLAGIDSGTKSSSVIKFKDFKSEPGKKKKKKKTKSKGVTRGGACDTRKRKKHFFSWF